MYTQWSTGIQNTKRLYWGFIMKFNIKIHQKLLIQNMPYSSDFSQPEKEFIKGTQIYIMVLKYVPVKFGSWLIKVIIFQSRKY